MRYQCSNEQCASTLFVVCTHLFKSELQPHYYQNAVFVTRGLHFAKAFSSLRSRRLLFFFKVFLTRTYSYHATMSEGMKRERDGKLSYKHIEDAGNE